MLSATCRRGSQQGTTERFGQSRHTARTATSRPLIPRPATQLSAWKVDRGGLVAEGEAEERHYVMLEQLSLIEAAGQSGCPSDQRREKRNSKLACNICDQLHQSQATLQY